MERMGGCFCSWLGVFGVTVGVIASQRGCADLTSHAASDFFRGRFIYGFPRFFEDGGFSRGEFFKGGQRGVFPRMSFLRREVIPSEFPIGVSIEQFDPLAECSVPVVVPSTGSTGDFNPQVSAPGRAHCENAPPPDGDGASLFPFLLAEGLPSVSFPPLR